MRFDLDRFIADCRLALAEDQSHKSVREVVGRAVSDPASILKELGEPRCAEVQKLYHSEDLTIFNVIWGPRMTIMPHNHQMWAVIGVYTGREDNISGVASPAARTVRWRPPVPGRCARRMRNRLDLTSFIR